MLSLVLIKNCKSCVYLIYILSNKLDLNQETRFTLLVYSSDFQIQLSALT
jgi:hypothetical protein